MMTQAEMPADPSWAWAAYEPGHDRPWNLAWAAHLYRRAAFGADWAQLQQALSDGPQRTVDKLLRPQTDVDAFNRTYDEQESLAAGSVDGLRAWWLRRMIETPHPLLEKMMLFWHGHFAVNATGVKDPRLMQQYVQLLRRHALGSFSDLLQAISRDPAMLTWLGADANRKAAPSEGFVRPLMETFTLGPGISTSADVCDAAKAFTGWFVLRGQLRYIAHEHDDSVKRILGREGDFAADDVVRIVLEQPATSRLAVRRMYRWLISETDEPDDALIAPLAEPFARDYSVSRLAESMLRSNLFFSQAAYRRRIKCPVEYAVGIAKAMEEVVSTTNLAEDAAGLGQDLCHPPTVKGWAGGRHWINSATVVGRQNLAQSLLAGGDRYGGKLDPWSVAQKHGFATPESAARFLLDLFVQGDVEPGVREALLGTVPASATNGDDGLKAAWRGFAHAVITLPEFHLA
jgi:uncharacterized protein (DUF1800 family)